MGREDLRPSHLHESVDSCKIHQDNVNEPAAEDAAFAQDMEDLVGVLCDEELIGSQQH